MRLSSQLQIAALILSVAGCSGSSGSGGAGGGSSAAGGGSSAAGGGSSAAGGGSSAAGGGSSAAGGGSSATGGGSSATGGGSTAAGGGTANTDGGRLYSIQNTECFDFASATVNGASCDMAGEGDGSLTTNLPSPSGALGEGALCDLTNNNTVNADFYDSLAQLPSTCAGHSWTNYIEGGGATLSRYGVLVYGGQALPDGGPAYYRVFIPNSSPTNVQINFQFAPVGG